MNAQLANDMRGRQSGQQRQTIFRGHEIQE